MKIPRQEPLEQDATERSMNFLEVSFGFDMERTFVEAQRCLDCKTPYCVDGCPVGIDIPGFIKLVLEKNYVGAVQKIREANYLPAICGRVCPQETQCEELCVMGKKLTPVAIGKMERFVADYEMRENLFTPPVIKEHHPEKVAVVGSGPAGLTCAAELALKGYRCHGLRSTACGRRGAAVRHPGVPPPQGDPGHRDGAHQGAGRGDPYELRRRTDRDDR